jgi:Major Facilitator Superfamily
MSKTGGQVPADTAERIGLKPLHRREAEMHENSEAVPAAASGVRPKRWLNRTVVGAGITSALGDFCYETTTVILPGFLAVLGIPVAWLGTIEGIADAVAAFTKMVSGYIADKLGHRKLLVLAGYGLTPLGQVFLALALGWPLLLLGRIISWFGKGLRGPLRDAIVIQAVTPETRGRAFGFHRATIGAVVGPLLGVALLGWAQGLQFRLSHGMTERIEAASDRAISYPTARESPRGGFCFYRSDWIDEPIPDQIERARSRSVRSAGIRMCRP